MEWETCFLIEVFFFGSSLFLFAPYLFLVVECGLLFHLFGLVASFFSALVLLHFHLVYDI